MRNYRVSLRFSRLSDSALKVFTTEVIKGMSDNPLFPAPLVPLPELTALQSAFGEAMVASELGGVLSTVVKNEARAALLGALRRQANYVQGVCQHDEAGMLASGFKPASLNRAPRPLEKPLVLKVLNVRTETLMLRIAPVPTARSYEVQRRTDGGEWQAAGIFQQARRMEIGALVPGALYDLRVRAIGGSTGYSDWTMVPGYRSL